MASYLGLLFGKRGSPMRVTIRCLAVLIAFVVLSPQSYSQTCGKVLEGIRGVTIEVSQRTGDGATTADKPLGESQIRSYVEAQEMKLWPSKNRTSKGQRTGDFDSLVWEASTLAQVSLLPFVNRFSQFGSILDSDLSKTWEHLMTIALVGVEAQTMEIMSGPASLEELKSVLDEELQEGANGFDNYYEFVTLRTEKVGASWSGVSAMWVAANLQLHSDANDALKKYAGELDFINRVGPFLNMSYGGNEGGISHFLTTMALDIEKEDGVDMGLGTKRTNKDASKRVFLLAEIFDQYARNAVKFIDEQ